MKFVSQNGEELVRNIFFHTHNVITGSSEFYWNMLKNTGLARLFRDEEHAYVSLLTTFISIRTELEMLAVYERYGDDVYRKLGEYVSSYYRAFLVNFTETEEDLALFLMQNAHETIKDNEGDEVDIFLALQLKKIIATDQDINPSIFQPLMPAISEGGHLVDIIDAHIEL